MSPRIDDCRLRGSLLAHATNRRLGGSESSALSACWTVSYVGDHIVVERKINALVDAGRWNLRLGSGRGEVADQGWIHAKVLRGCHGSSRRSDPQLELRELPDPLWPSVRATGITCDSTVKHI